MIDTVKCKCVFYFYPIKLYLEYHCKIAMIMSISHQLNLFFHVFLANEICCAHIARDSPRRLGEFSVDVSPVGMDQTLKMDGKKDADVML